MSTLFSAAQRERSPLARQTRRPNVRSHEKTASQIRVTTNAQDVHVRVRGAVNKNISCQGHQYCIHPGVQERSGRQFKCSRGSGRPRRSKRSEEHPSSRAVGSSSIVSTLYHHHQIIINPSDSVHNGSPIATYYSQCPMVEGTGLDD